jgi:tetratricopeptide (TPR) repeat protein
VGIYQRDVAEKGAKSHAAARLGWAYIRLGQEKPAKELVALLKTEESERAMAFFLEGAGHLQWDAGSEESNQGLYRSWSRALELNPNFKGFEGISAAQMRAQLERLKPQLGEPVDALALAQERVQGVTAAALAATAAKPTEVEPEVPAVEPEVPAAEPDDPERQYRITVARAELALNEAKYQEAEELFIQAKALVPSGFAAEFGHLRAGWGQEGARPRIRPRFEELAKRDDLTGRQAYDLGIFLLNVVQDKALAAGVLNRVKTLDPELAGRVNIDKILQ